MTPDPRPSSDETSPSAARIALALAAFLGLVVVGLNLVAPQAFRVSQNQFRELVDSGAIVSIEIGERTLRGELAGSMEFGQQGRRVQTEQVSVVRDGSVDIADLEAKGIRIISADTGGAGGTDDIWLVVVVGLLGVGTWYLFAQARHNRSHGSPRQRLRELETEFREGRMSREEYERQASAISTDV